MKINLTVKDGATAELQAFEAKLSGEGRQRLLTRAGKRLEVLLRKHFLAKDARPNKRGWPKQHFWLRMRRATALTKADHRRAVVTVADPAFAAKVYGATIRAKESRALTIPLRPESYGRRASEFDGLFLLRSRKGNAFLARPRQDGESLRASLLYLLKKTVRTPADPTALPPASAVDQQMQRAIASHLRSN